MEGLFKLWKQADSLAAQAPPTRNRYVDFLRAASICVVVVGHFLVAAPFIRGDELVAGHMLQLAPWTQWLTLAVQVMPIFFLVGGYSNGLAWAAAQRDGVPYAVWLTGRMRRLLVPVLPVLIAWIGIAAAALAFGAPREILGLMSQAALVPTWFLAVYVMIVVLVPVTHAAWKQSPLGSIVALIAAAVLTELVAIGAGFRGVAYLNYAFVWLAIHQLGYAWEEGRLHRPLAWAAAGAVAAGLLVHLGPYPLAMVGVPGLELDNTGPPTLALLCFGIAQSGIIVALEGLGRRLLAHRVAWTSTVLVNGMIMTLYLWHMTAMLLALGIALAAGGIGLGFEPDSAAWWAARPVWLLAYAACLVPLVAIFSRFERPGAAAATPVSRRRLVAAATLSCFGLYALAGGGIVSGSGLRVLPAVMPLVGAGVASFGPLARVLAPGERRTS